VAAGIVAAMAQAWELGVAHGSLAPDVVFVDAERRLSLITGFFREPAATIPDDHEQCAALVSFVAGPCQDVHIAAEQVRRGNALAAVGTLSQAAATAGRRWRRKSAEHAISSIREGLCALEWKYVPIPASCPAEIVQEAALVVSGVVLRSMAPGAALDELVLPIVGDYGPATGIGPARESVARIMAALRATGHIWGECGATFWGAAPAPNRDAAVMLYGYASALALVLDSSPADMPTAACIARAHHHATELADNPILAPEVDLGWPAAQAAGRPARTGHQEALVFFLGARAVPGCHGVLLGAEFSVLASVMPAAPGLAHDILRRSLRVELAAVDARTFWGVVNGWTDAQAAAFVHNTTGGAHESDAPLRVCYAEAVAGVHISACARTLAIHRAAFATPAALATVLADTAASLPYNSI